MRGATPRLDQVGASRPACRMSADPAPASSAPTGAQSAAALAVPQWAQAGQWPRPADPNAARRLIDDLSAASDVWRVLAIDAAPALAAIGGNSPFLADLALRDQATLQSVLCAGPDGPLAELMASLARELPTQPQARIAARLREAKRRAALIIALADISGQWHVQQVTAALSDLAEATLQLAVAHLLRTAHDRGDLVLPDPDRPDRGSAFTVLGMGKLGARELNYSSDIDLVLLYDPDRHTYSEDGGRSVFVRVARGLVTLMEARDANGYVFRTDLRLRPDPSSTPLAISLPGALTYYESMGQTWERAAMIKARPVAGDLALGQHFLDAIRPFIWRRHLDFAAIADIQAMKARIDAHKGSRLPPMDAPATSSTLAGYDLKLGQGGIREIEFMAQTLQMVWGGRDPSLRDPATLPAMAALARAGRLPADAVPEYAASYELLRRAEHRLQMIADRQTHSLPTRPDEITRFAIFMGAKSAGDFTSQLLAHLRRVHARFAGLFADAPPNPVMIEGDWRPDALRDRLRELGFGNIEPIARTIEGWRAGHLRALRSERARALLRELLPAVLASLARQAEPDAAFARFDQFLGRLPAGVQLLSLFQRNPALFDRIAAVLGAAPMLAEHLASTQSALEGLLGPDDPARCPLRPLRRQLRGSTGLEESVRIVGRFVRGEEFRLSVALMEGRLSTDDAGMARSLLAEATLAVLLPAVLSDFVSRHGRVPGGAMVVVALGKAGSREMLPGSDLDLMLIYDHPEDVTESDGARPVPASTWFTRAASAVVAAISAPGAEGPLYDIDMRLRPSGNKGPVAVRLASFVHYHQHSAWTWERMALTRARVVAGPSALRRKVAAALRAALASAGPAARIRADACAMRARLERDMPAAGWWDVKLRRGGLMEVEFIAQVLELFAAADHPELCDPTTHVALARLAAAGLLPLDDAELLARADRVWRTVQGLLRLTVGRASAETLPSAAFVALRRGVACELYGDPSGCQGLDLAGLRATLDALAQQVRTIFIRHVGRPGES
jgi:glutamate-ammonia-ligase adenylyltransferase